MSQMTVRTGIGARRWLCRKRRVPESYLKLRVFMFPPAGGDIAIYHRWEEYLPAEAEVCLVCLPGRGGRMNEPLIDDCNLMAAKIVDNISEYFDLPYVFFGHSMGALLAYKSAALAEDRGLRLPERLFLSSLKSPKHMNESGGLLDEEPLYLMDDETLKRRLLQIGGIPGVILENENIFDYLLPTFRGDLKLCETYSHTDTARLPIPFDVFGGNSDQIASKADLEGWRECTDKEVTITVFPGGHFYFNSSVNLFLFNLSKRLNDVLNTISAKEELLR